MRSLTTPAHRTRALVADLQDLAIDLAGGSYSRTTLEMIQRDLRRCVASALGASVTVADTVEREGSRLNLMGHSVEPDEVAATLSVPLRPFSSGVQGEVTFYASEPDAFVRLAADLTATLGLVPGEADQRPQRLAEPLHPVVRGLQDLAVINQAVGILVGRGYGLERARAEVRRRGDRAGTGLLEAAHAILDSYC